ncbi:MAG: prefoldin subunit beta [Candidatus Aenigmatarchaeota archaeon]
MMLSKEKPLSLPPEAQQMFVQLQALRQQMQSIAIQKEGMSIQRMENDKALEELEKAKESDEVFKAVGPILIKSSKKDMKKELQERNETIDVRLKALEKQESAAKDKALELQTGLQKMLSGAPAQKAESDEEAG